DVEAPAHIPSESTPGTRTRPEAVGPVLAQPATLHAEPDARLRRHKRRLTCPFRSTQHCARTCDHSKATANAPCSSSGLGSPSQTNVGNDGTVMTMANADPGAGRNATA